MLQYFVRPEYNAMVRLLNIKIMIIVMMIMMMYCNDLGILTHSILHSAEINT